MSNEWFDHFEAKPTSVVGKIVRNPWSVIDEPDRTIGQVEAHTQLCMALVDPVSHADPTTKPTSQVKEVVVATLVEVRRLFRFVHQIIRWQEAHSHSTMVLRPCGSWIRSCDRRPHRPERSTDPTLNEASP